MFKSRYSVVQPISNDLSRNINYLVDLLRDDSKIFYSSHQLDQVPHCFVFIPCYKEIFIGTEDGSLIQFDFKYLEEKNRFKFHKKSLTILKLSDSQKFLVTASQDSSIGIFDLNQSDLVKSKSIFPYIPEAVCLIEERKIICIGSDDRNIRIWDYDGEVISHLVGHTGSVSTIILLDPGTIITSSSDHTVRVWDLEKKSELHLIIGHKPWTNTVILSNNKQTLSTGGGDSLIKLWSSTCLTEKCSLSGHTGEIYSLSFSPDDSLLASGSQDKTIRVWNISTKSVVYKSEDHISYIESVRISEHSNLLVSSCHNLMLVDSIEDKRNEAMLEGHNGSLTCFDLVEDGRIVISASYDKTLKFWDISQSDKNRCFEGHSNSVSCLLFMNEINLIISGGWDSVVIVWQFKEARPYKKLLGHTNYISCLAQTQDSSKILSGSWDNTVKVWDTESFNLIHSFTGPHQKILKISVSGDSDYFACNAGDCKIWIWSLVSCSLIESLDLTNIASCPKITPDNKVVITDLDGFLQVYDIGTGIIEQEYKFQSGIIGYENSKDWSVIFLCMLDKSIVCWDLEVFTSISVVKAHNCKNSFQMHILSSHLFSLVSNENELQIFDTQKQIEIYSFISPSSIKSSITTADSMFIIVGTTEGTVIIFNIKERRVEATIKGQNTPIESLEISQCGKYLVSGSRSGSIKMWKLNKYLKFQKELNDNTLEYNTMRSEIRFSLRKITVHNYKDKYDDMKDRYPALICHGFKQRFAKKLMPTTSDCLILLAEQINLTHLYSYLGMNRHLEKALEYGCPIRRDEKGQSPLYYCISKDSKKCIDVILQHLTNLSKSEEHYQKYLEFNYALRDDINQVFQLSSSKLPEYLESIFVVSRSRLLPNSVREIKLPALVFADHQKISFDRFKDLKTTQCFAKFEKFVEFRSTPFELNLTDGSLKCQNLLKSFFYTRNNQIFTTKLVKAILDYKFNHFYVYILIRSLILSLNIACMLFSLIYLDSHPFFHILFLIMSLIMVFHEIFQINYEGLAIYICIFHNKLNLLSSFLSISWSFTYYFIEDNAYLKWLMVLTNFLKGLHIFEAFTITRFYVLLLFNLLSETYPFLIIFLYNTLAFGVLYLASVGLQGDVFSTLWKAPFDINFKGFTSSTSPDIEYLYYIIATLINVVMMLNILIAVLVDSFYIFKADSVQMDYRDKLCVILEIESIFIWNTSRKSGFLHFCDIETKDTSDLSVSEKIDDITQSISLKLDELKRKQDKSFSAYQAVEQKLNLLLKIE